ncbi:unnamed protein product, partial [Didymodactylos carnosus]
KGLQVRVHLSAKHEDVSQSYHNLGVVYFKQDETQLALKYLTETLVLRVQNASLNHHLITETCQRIGKILHSDGDYEKPLENFQKTIKLKLISPQTAYSQNDVTTLLNFLEEETRLAPGEPLPPLLWQRGNHTADRIIQAHQDICIEWGVLDKISTLKSFETATRQLALASLPTISKVLPVVTGLFTSLEPLSFDPQTVQKLKDALRSA